MLKLLIGHISPETAYVVEDYPYGFRLRCEIRYWLEYTPKRGVRLWSQTGKSLAGGLVPVWNKPKASIYCRLGGAMFLDNEGHVQWSGLTEYSTAAESIAWRDEFGSANHPACAAVTDAWIQAKLSYENRKV